MKYGFFLMPLLSSFVIATVMLVVFIMLAKKVKMPDGRRGLRHIHAYGISRFGGVAIITSFVVALLLDKRLVITTPLLGVLIASGAILVFGVIDDLRRLGWKSQLLFQFTVVSLVYAMGVRLQYVSNPLGGIFFFDSGLSYFAGLSISIIWVVFLMNVMNWVDGADGISGGITLIASVTIFVLSQRPEVNQPPIGIIMAALIGSLAAFLLLNFHPAKIMAGTSGSMFMGFILAILAIFAGAKIATTLMILVVPIIDALWVIGQRLKLKKSIFVADRRHLHYRLLELGWSTKRICAFYYVVTVIIAVLALDMRAIGKVATLIAALIFLVALLSMISRRTADAEEVQV